MAAITFTQRGNFKRTNKFLRKMKTEEIFHALDLYGQLGVYALASTTPTDTGFTASSWTYEVTKEKGDYQITWMNDNVIPGHGPLVIMLQYGHGTGGGGYVRGRDFINPAIQPIFQRIADSVWNEVQSA